MSNVNLHIGCKSIRAANDSGPRNLQPKYIVIHSTESPNNKGSARAVANYFKNGAPASVQVVMDDFECYRCLPDMVIPWGAPPFNSRGLHIEQCGRAAWTRAEWFEHRATIDRTAKAAAYWAKYYSIPPRWLSPARCKNYMSGITSHRNVAIAFGKTDHTDPGPEDNKHYPYDYFLRKVQSIYDGIS